jgi:hypothetical protein
MCSGHCNSTISSTTASSWWHHLRDIGCGTSRGGRYFIRYLDPDRYTGVDISSGAIETVKGPVIEKQLTDKPRRCSTTRFRMSRSAPCAAPLARRPSPERLG